MGWLLTQPDPAPNILCFTCGPIAVSSAAAPCPMCGAPVYDLASPGDRAIAEYALREREERRGGVASYLAMLAGMVVAFGLAAAFDSFLMFTAPVILCAGLVVFPLVRLIMKRRSAVGERAMAAALPGRRPRFWPRVVTGVPVALVAIGIAVDLRVGRFLCAVLLAASAVAGGLAHAALTGATSVPMVGASGMAYGLLGASLALMPSRRYALTLAGAPFELPAYVLWPLFVSLYAVIDATTRVHVAWLGHLGGLAAGVTVGLCLRRVAPPAAFALHEARREERLASARRWM